MDTTKRTITWKTYAAYGAADLYGGGCFFIVTTFAMYYLVNVVGLHPLLAGLIPAIGKFWDAVSDPLMGYIADHTPQNRFGKRRVWFLASIVPIALSFMLIWFPAQWESQAGKFIFYTLAYIIFFTVATVSYIPYAALSAEITQSFSQRNKLNSSRLMFSFIATLLGGLLAQPIINAFNGTKMGYFVMSCIFALIFSLPWIPLYFGTWEPAQTHNENVAEKDSFIKNFLSLFKSKSCRIHIAMYVCSYGALDIFMSLVLFYMVDYLNSGSVFVIAQGSLLITMMLTLPIHSYFINKKGHRPVYITGLSIFAVSLILMSFHTPGSSPVLLILNMVLMGVGISANNLIPHQLLPFLSDIDKLMSGKSRAGTYSAAMTLTRKIFLGLVIMTGLGAILNGIGYKNPVPSVLTQEQFNQAQVLCEKHGVPFSQIQKYYTECSDMNYHLKYVNRSIDGILKELYKREKKASLEAAAAGKQLGTQTNSGGTPSSAGIEMQDTAATAGQKTQADFASDFSAEKTAIPAAVFEKLIASLHTKDFHDADYELFLTSLYRKTGDTYVYEPNTDFYTKSDLYDLKLLLEKIKYPYSGIGEVQKPLQKERTLFGVKLAFIFLPLIMLITGIITALNFKVTPENHNIVLKELERLKAGGKKEDADPETKAVCEMLIGSKYA